MKPLKATITPDRLIIQSSNSFNDMKYLLSSLLFVLLFGGCSTPKEITNIPGRVDVAGIDFTEYTKRGFLFTPESYSRRYNSIGVVSVIVWAEMNRQESEKIVRGHQQAEVNLGYKYGPWRADYLQMQEAIHSMYEQATGMGADALVNFESKGVVAPHPIYSSVQVPGIEISGFAIKRLD